MGDSPGNFYSKINTIEKAGQGLGAACGLKRDVLGMLILETLRQIIEPGMAVLDEERCAGGCQRLIQTVLGNIYANNNIHLIPYLPNRASHTQAAPATVGFDEKADGDPGSSTGSLQRCSAGVVNLKESGR